MGLLQDGRWVDQWFDTRETGGRFVRGAPPRLPQITDAD